ncbi:TVP38/TMEM64 family protein [Spirochaetia bacterium 38H-sp]|uniref:TVP38/TMEM64 family membrane protein n=1 Tax=Rarispira pelagica TaxID=3141764 RepID=A0ABU9U8Q6_9SPIR
MKGKFKPKDFIFPVFIFVIFLLVFLVVVFAPDLWSIISDSKKISALIKDWGIWAPVGFIIFQILQVIIFIIPGEVAQISGGFIFGPFLGFLYSVIGIALGSSFNYFIAKFSGRSFIEDLVGKKEIENFDTFILKKRTESIFFILFIIPGIPKDILCYVAGLGNINFPSFLIISMLARFPGIIGSVWIGHALFEKEWFMAALIGAVAIGLFIIGSLKRDKLTELISRLRKKQEY